MRPLKDILTEEYWTVLYRKVDSPDQGVFADNPAPFLQLPAAAEAWYADTFLFARDGELYLFLERFDNRTEKGTIAVSRLEDGRFSTPVEVLEEPFHLSYPYVFEADGEVYMMPETCADGCIRLYRAQTFPFRWVRERVLVPDVHCVDTVPLDEWLVTGQVCPEADMRIDLLLFRRADGAPHPQNPIRTGSFCDRGAGAVVTVGGKRLRPVQDCEGSVYGRRIVFKEVVQADGTAYADREAFSLTPDQVPTGRKRPLGVHTYAFLNGYEVVDAKFRRRNPRRIWWIIRKKLVN